MNRRGFLTGLGALVLATAVENSALARTRRGLSDVNCGGIVVNLPNSRDGNKLTLYFRTNSWRLDRRDLADLNGFYRDHQNSDFIIEGHSDARGSIDDNLQLGRNRAQGVEQFLRGYGVRRNIQTTSYGENNPIAQGDNLRSYQRNRRVVVIANEQVLTRALNLSEADVYLLDATGSMNGDKWNTVVNHAFPANSRIYAFNGCTGLTEITSARNITPDCGTPLWDSAGNLINSMEQNKKITILSDGADNESTRYDVNSLATLARQRRINVSTIGIGVDQVTRDALIHLARVTDGNFYVSN